jgi:hypothetical protein
MTLPESAVLLTCLLVEALIQTFNHSRQMERGQSQPTASKCESSSLAEAEAEALECTALLAHNAVEPVVLAALISSKISWLLTSRPPSLSRSALEALVALLFQPTATMAKTALMESQQLLAPTLRLSVAKVGQAAASLSLAA